MTAIEPALARPSNGGLPARRAMVRWAWRLLRREWRQQLLVLALITTAIAATVIGIGVSSNTPSSLDAIFGTANFRATLSGTPAQISTDIASLQKRVDESAHRLDVIENQILTVPGSIETFDLRAQNPKGLYGGPLIGLVSGHYPVGPDEVAVTSSVATDFHLAVGDTWHVAGLTRHVVGIVENPSNLLDAFALVAPGQVKSPTQVTVLFDLPRGVPVSLPNTVQSRSTATSSNAMNPETITIALATLAMILVGLVAVAGFTVLAQRRRRAFGMLESLGATDRNVRLVVRANGVLVGVVGALLGLVLGLALWLAYRPSLETDAHHSVGTFALPWVVIVIAMALAILASFLAASRPARAITKTSVVAALAGRPEKPRAVHRTAVPGIISLVAAFFLLGYAGASGGNGGGMFELVIGFVALTVAIVLLAPFLLAALAKGTHRGPFALRMALRDLARYRSRSGAALSAVGLAIMVAVVICVASAARFGNVLDYAGPNLSSNQLLVYTANGPYGPGGPGNAGAGNAVTTSSLAAETASAMGIAQALDAQRIVELDSTSATIQHAANGRSYSGPLYVATPPLLKAFGIKASQLNPDADVLSMRPGFASISKMQLVYGNYFSNGGRRGPNGFPCPKTDCLANPVIEQVPALPAGTSAPNTVITEHALHQLHLNAFVSGWLLQTAQPLSAAQIADTRATAAAAGMSIETKSSIPTSATIIDWATVVGMVLALGILAMSIGLVRSEQSSDLRILTATGASSFARRTISATTAGALGLLGAVVGTVGGYLALIAFSRNDNLDGLSSLTSVPILNLALILLAMPAIAAAAGWLFAGREPRAISRQPIE